MRLALYSANFGLLCLVAAAFSCAPSTVVVRPIAEEEVATAQPYRIAPDDVLDVIVWKQPQVSGKVTVAADGTITIALADRVSAAGLTTAQLQRELTRRLSAFIADPTVTVRVADARSQVVYVMGEVRRPGVFRLRPGEVLSQALAEAGGFEEFADTSAVRITRHTPSDPERIVVNYDRVLSGKELSGDVALVAGDTIDVP
ncbi:MAG TPA: polysaccharide biosynthesis/export family protein [Candidatus Binataceae bacterium]|nr:polysaccharide biosynthesis/export family protein [Candidatus Binataceae bacterium]